MIQIYLVLTMLCLLIGCRSGDSAEVTDLRERVKELEGHIGNDKSWTEIGPVTHSHPRLAVSAFGRNGCAIEEFLLSSPKLPSWKQRGLLFDDRIAAIDPKHMTRRCQLDNILLVKPPGRERPEPCPANVDVMVEFQPMLPTDQVELRIEIRGKKANEDGTVSLSVPAFDCEGGPESVGQIYIVPAGHKPSGEVRRAPPKGP